MTDKRIICELTSEYQHEELEKSKRTRLDCKGPPSQWLSNTGIIWGALKNADT